MASRVSGRTDTPEDVTELAEHPVQLSDANLDFQPSTQPSNGFDHRGMLVDLLDQVEKLGPRLPIELHVKCKQFRTSIGLPPNVVSDPNWNSRSNRSKSKIVRRLLASGKYATLDAAVKTLCAAICAAQCPRDRMRVLIKGWKFLLPMASAILTVLYPTDFTVYDVRVCGVLGKYEDVQNKIDFDHIWNGYCEYMAAVNRTAPAALCLRDKDRWLWGKSFYDQLQRDIDQKFPYRSPRASNEE